jgi:hypothetical protein
MESLDKLSERLEIEQYRRIYLPINCFRGIIGMGRPHCGRSWRFSGEREGHACIDLQR